MRLSYGGLFVAMLLAMVAFRFVTAAYQGLLALTAQEQLMSGRLSALWQITAMLASFIGGVAGGYAVGHLSHSQTFLLVAALTLTIGLLSLWKPQSVFRHVYEKPQARRTNFVGDMKRLIRHSAIYPPVLITLLFEFSPGMYTPMQFYLTGKLHAPDATYGQFIGIALMSFIPAFFLYSFLCKRFSLKTLLWVGSIVAVPQMIPLALVNSGDQALMLAVPIGLLGGLATGAHRDLTMRSCPPGLHGSLMMMVDGIAVLSLRASDVVGSAIYDASPEKGFLYCVIATTVVYALILPILLLIPANVISTADGEANPELQAEVLAETSAKQVTVQ
jgi:Na+/melibiose symporter-like transporter